MLRISIKLLAVLLTGIGGLFFLIAGCGNEGDLSSATRQTTRTRGQGERFSRGRIIVNRSCNECHTLYAPQEYTRAEWTAILPEMLERTRLSQEEREAVKAYLTPSLKTEADLSVPSTTSTSALSSTAKMAKPTRRKEGDFSRGRIIVSRSCNECHSLYKPQEYTPAEWTELLPDMANRAKLSETERKAVEVYLRAASGGKK